MGRRALNLVLLIGLSFLGVLAMICAVAGILWLVQTVLNAEEES